MRELTLDCLPEEQVFWFNLEGSRFQGTLKEWDSNVAYVKCTDGLTRPVEVN